MSDDVLTPDTILVSRAPGETRYALLAEETVLNVVHRRDVDVQPGAVYSARVRAQVPGVNAVFVDFGVEPLGILSMKPPFPTEGTPIVVSVVVPPRPGKGATLKQIKRALLAGGKVPALLEPAPEPMVDWCNRYGAAIRAIICQPVREVTRVRALLDDGAPVESYTSGADLFAAMGVNEAIEAALRPEVPLPCGGSIIIETTAAFTAIDVNSGPADPTRANYEAVAAVALELRRRNIAGHIVVDMIPTRARAALPRLMSKAVAADPVPTTVVGSTPLGMIELTRERQGLSLSEALHDALPVRVTSLSAPTVGYQALRAAVRFALAEKVSSVAVAAAPDVVAALKGPLAQASTEARDQIKGDISLTPRAEFRRDQFDVRPL